MIHRRSFLAFMASTLTARLAAAPSKPPNIVFILCDDLGYGDLGCYGSKIPTPNLDRMAAAGARFTNFSSADPVCSPSRAALLTGRYPTRVGVPHVFFPQDKGGMNLDEVTLANVLKNRGYRTICIGKWHLGRPVEYLPTSRGHFREADNLSWHNGRNTSYTYLCKRKSTRNGTRAILLRGSRNSDRKGRACNRPGGIGFCHVEMQDRSGCNGFGEM